MTPFVLIPGMMCDARLFGPQINEFSSSYNLYLATMRSHASMEALASELLKSLPPRFALCGLSMGGILAMEVLRQAPEKVERIALLDTNPLTELEEVKQKRIPQMESVRQGRLLEIMRDEMKPNYLADGPRRKEILDLCMEMALGLGPDIFIRQSKALMTRRDQTETLKRAGIPALVLCGRDDALCPVSRHELMADLLSASMLEIVEKAGHLPTLEMPDAVNAALKNWLEA